MLCEYPAGDKTAAQGKNVPFQAVSQKSLDSDEVKDHFKKLGM